MVKFVILDCWINKFPFNTRFLNLKTNRDVMEAI